MFPPHLSNKSSLNYLVKLEIRVFVQNVMERGVNCKQNTYNISHYTEGMSHISQTLFTVLWHNAFGRLDGQTVQPAKKAVERKSQVGKAEDSQEGLGANEVQHGTGKSFSRVYVTCQLYSISLAQCDFRFDLFFSFSFSFPVIFSF